MRTTLRLVLAFGVAVSVGCGGRSPAPRDSSSLPDGLWQPAPGVTPASGNFVYLESQPGDDIGGGETHTYTQDDAWIYFDGSGTGLAVSVAGGQNWWGEFQPAPAAGQLRPGYYGDLQRFPTADPYRGGMNWRGTRGSCDALSGWFVVDEIALAADLSITAINLRFEQQCQSNSAVLHGQIRWSADEPTAPSGPGAPPPGTLWQPASDAIPSSGNYVYLESDPDDFVGGGQTHTYTPASAHISVTAAGHRLFVNVIGDQIWRGSFEVSGPSDGLQDGYYDGALHYGFPEPGHSALEWRRSDVSWPLVTGPIGWFTIDSVTYTDGILTAVDLRFEQHYEGAAAALHGKIHWSGPWQPASGATPASGSYVYLESEAGEAGGSVQAETYTPLNAHLTMVATGKQLLVKIDRGHEWWEGNLQVTGLLAQIEPGRYTTFQHYPFQDPALAGLSWSHGGPVAWSGVGCDATAGWIIVDGVTYAGDVLTAIDLRFEQKCSSDSLALHGQIHWSAADAMPSGLWRPAPGVTPATGNYVFLESEPGDYLGGGQTYLYTEASGYASLYADWVPQQLSVDIVGNERWRGDFKVSSSLSRFEPGFYGDLQRLQFVAQLPLEDVTSFDWIGEGRSCSTLNGWFAVDDAAYLVNHLTAIDLRFELHCEGAVAALHGQIHWADAEAVAPPGPVVPPPPTLWQPAPSAVPATGSYVYLENEESDGSVGTGWTSLYTSASARLEAPATGDELIVIVGGPCSGDECITWWRGNFQTMKAISRFQPGFYGGLRRYFQYEHPDRGALDWNGTWGCNKLTGWFVVDRAEYVTGIMTGIDLRFEQHCENMRTALHGQIHWSGDIWQPAPGTTPATGNYVYLESMPGDYIGGGQTYTYTPDTTSLAVSATGGFLTVNVGGGSGWYGRFQAPSSLARLQEGSYPDLWDYPFHYEPAVGGLDWSGMGRANGWSTGWFIIDRVVYAGETLSGLDLRFEQRGGAGTSPPLHGKIHYDAP